MQSVNLRGLALALALAITLAASLLPAGLSAQTASGVVALAASSTVDTAVELSQQAFATADRVLISRDDVFADALASGVLQSDSPLLVTPTASLDDAVATEIQRLGATRATILGGTAAISTDVADALEDLGLTVNRLAGGSRAETAATVSTGATDNSTAFIVRSREATEPTQAFADSLAVGGWAADTGRPVLLTPTNRLDSATLQALTNQGITQVTIIGGRSAIADTVTDALRDEGITTSRLAGETRSDTAIRVAVERGFATAADADTIILVESRTEDAWAAGFSAAAAAAQWDAPIILAEGGNLSPETREWLGEASTASTTRQGTAPPQLLCAVAQDTCDEAAALLGITGGTGGGGGGAGSGEPTGTITQDGGDVHRGTPLTGTVSDTTTPTVRVTGTCITGGSQDVAVSGGAFSVPVSSTAAEGTCQLGMAAGDTGQPMGSATVNVVVVLLSMNDEGTVLDDDSSLGQIIPPGGVSGVQFTGCFDDAVIASTSSGFDRITASPQQAFGWCSVSGTISFADGGAQTFTGAGRPNTFRCTGFMVTAYDRPGDTLEVTTSGLTGAWDYSGHTSYELNGTPTDLATLRDAIGLGDCVSRQGTTLRGWEIDPGCPAGQSVIARLNENYHLDGGGSFDSSIEIFTGQDHTYRIDGVDTDRATFLGLVGTGSCVSYQPGLGTGPGSSASIHDGTPRNFTF